MKKMLKLKAVAFLLTLTTLLSIICMPVLADDGINQTPSVGPEAPSHTNESGIAVTQQETDLAVPTEKSVTSVSSVQVVNNTANTSIFLSSGVDMALNVTQQLFVVTTLSTADSVSISVDKPALLSIGSPTSLYEGEMYVLITAKQVGVATVTAEVNRGDTVLETVSIEIYVTMDDGIYLIKNCATHLPTSLGDYYLRVGEPSAAPPTIHASTNTYGGMTNNIYRYWHIEYAGNGAYYIRPLMDESLSLRPTGYNNITVAAGTPENGGFNTETVGMRSLHSRYCKTEKEWC